MATPEKEAVVDQIADILSRSKGVFLTDFTGLDVQSITKLRKRLKEESVSYRVVKNSLTSLAVERAGFPQLKEFLVGPTGIAYTKDDPVGPARVLVDFAEDGRRLRIKSGLVEGSVILSGQIDELVKLPPKEVLLTQVVSGVSSPLTGFVSLFDGILRNFIYNFDGILRNFIYTLEAVRERKACSRPSGSGEEGEK